ncbi:hypothetical protein [Mycobacterium deserti]|uniref:PE-PGRS family protein n=1 Tax=Mycobacterium deserti TaxID=2978347 RepID=A0ABT2MBS5_9MYCO|nr:hypothetical protein [Mycobacterium deserti]MCT7659721.1 hypothetical protein [Mycobacterium deserti]
MRTALRPYMTTGIALVGASVIALTPVTAPPPHMPAVEVAAPATAMRAVTADVQLTALLDDLVAAVQQSITETIKLYTQTLPDTAADLVSAGRFAHLAVLAVNTAYLTPLTIIAPFAVGLMQAIPKPLGTMDGVINEALKMIIQTPAVTGVSILSLFASIIDDGLSPFDAVVGAFGYLTEAVTKTVESLQKIATTLGGALPIADLAPPPAIQARQQAPALATEIPAVLDDSNVVPASLNSSNGEGAIEPLTATVAADSEDTEANGLSEAEDETADESQEDVDDGLTPNGGTDMSDGNQAERGTAGEVAAGDDEPSTDAAGDTVVDAGDDTGETTADGDTESGATGGTEGPAE